MSTAVGASFVFAAGVLVGWLFSWAVGRRREKLRARFLSFVAHEINTPITALNMTVMNFIQGTFGPLSKDHEPWMRMLQGDVTRLTNLVGDLRDLIHLDFHRDLTVEKESVDLGTMVSELVDDIRDSMKRSDIEVSLSIEKDTPPASGDSDRLKRVVSALLQHARKFQTKGKVVVTYGSGADDTVELAVEFDGDTPKEENLGQALDLYYPVHNPHVQVLSGVGLGLGLPYALIQAHGGDMQFTVDDKGLTRVAFQIPRHEGGS